MPCIMAILCGLTSLLSQDAKSVDRLDVWNLQGTQGLLAVLDPVHLDEYELESDNKMIIIRCEVYMAALLETSDQALPVTKLARQFKAYLDKICNREQDKFVVMRNNVPAAVLLSVERFEALMEELEDLRIEAAAQERLAHFDGKTISHAEMLQRFED